jgi:hypothetical protein
MSSTMTHPREAQLTFGRVYQISLDKAEVVIDWQPSSPIMGFKVLTHGRAVFHPTEGKVVRFPGASRRKRRTCSIVVRTKLRPDLLELFDLAIKMEAELGTEATSSNKTNGSANGGRDRRDSQKSTIDLCR